MAAKIFNGVLTVLPRLFLRCIPIDPLIKHIVVRILVESYCIARIADSDCIIPNGCHIVVGQIHLAFKPTYNRDFYSVSLHSQIFMDWTGPVVLADLTLYGIIDNYRQL